MFLFFLTLLNYVLWYCIWSVLVRPYFLFCPRRFISFEVVVSFSPCSYRLLLLFYLVLFFPRWSILLTIWFVFYWLTYVHERIIKRKGQRLLLIVFNFIREGTDLGTNVSVSLIPDGQSYYRYDLELMNHVTGYLISPRRPPLQGLTVGPAPSPFLPLFSVSWLDRPRQRKGRVYSPAFAFVVHHAARSLLAVFATIPSPPPPRLILAGIGPGAFLWNEKGEGGAG